MRVLMITFSLLFSVVINASNTPAEFKTDSYQKLLVDKNQPFLMVMWSLDCPPCIKELTMLGSVYKQYPNLNLVLVSTDSMSRTEDINQLLKDSGLSEIDNRVFSDTSVQHLRYAIDPGWYGELPRSYFHTKNNTRRAVSGLLDASQVVSWLKINSQVSHD